MESQQNTNFKAIPTEIVTEVMTFMTHPDLDQVRMVSRVFNDMYQTQVFSDKLCANNFCFEMPDQTPDQVVGLLRGDRFVRSIDIGLRDRYWPHMPEFAGLIRKNRTIHSLFIGYVMDDQLTLILDAIRGHPTIRHLRFYDSRFRTHGFDLLGAFMRDNTTIIDLRVDLGPNPFQDGGGMELLARGLCVNQTVRRLSFRMAALTDASMPFLKQLVLSNPNLERLFVCSNRFTRIAVDDFTSFVSEINPKIDLTM